MPNGCYCVPISLRPLFFMQPLWWHFGRAFRISELVTGFRNDASGRTLCMADVQLDPKALQIILHFSKTDQKGKGSAISLGACDDSALCPVLALH